MISVRLAGRLNVWIILDTRYVKLCKIVLLVVLYLLMPPSVTLIVFQGHSTITLYLSQREILSENFMFLFDYLLKLYMIVYYVN